MAAPTYGCGQSQGPQGQRPGAKWDLGRIVAEPVSFTHLTLPTN